MRINVKEIQRTHTTVVYDPDRQEETVTGDIRTVSVALEPAEVEDILSTGSYRHTPTMMRPEWATLQWQRNTAWAGGVWGNTSWNHNEVHPEWRLDDARIIGTNIRKDGSVGRQTCAKFHRNQFHTDDPLNKMPDWFVKILVGA